MAFIWVQFSKRYLNHQSLKLAWKLLINEFGTCCFYPYPSVLDNGIHPKQYTLYKSHEWNIKKLWYNQTKRSRPIYMHILWDILYGNLYWTPVHRGDISWCRLLHSLLTHPQCRHLPALKNVQWNCQQFIEKQWKFPSVTWAHNSLHFISKSYRTQYQPL